MEQHRLHALTSLWVQGGHPFNGCNVRNAERCLRQVQKWSAELWTELGHRNTTIANSIFSSSRRLPSPGTVALLGHGQVIGGANRDGSRAVYANEDGWRRRYDVYYRHENPRTLSTTVLWNWGADQRDQSVNAEKFSNFTAPARASGHRAREITVWTCGSPENNQVFVRSPQTRWTRPRTSTSGGKPRLR